jgi:3-dehydro-L-gulonate-6-phosphate decarboxylase
MKPKLQLALDLTDLDSAIALLKAKPSMHSVDILEVGTVLLASAGKQAITEVRRLFPEKTIVADLKIADAAKTISKLFYDAGADFVSVIAAADIKSMEIAQLYAQERHKTIQIELYGSWDFTQAQAWLDVGIKHVIYHHSRDAGKEWSKQDFDHIKRFIDMGFIVNVTGGITVESIKRFEGLKIYSFIVGRGIYESEDVDQTIEHFKREINLYF